MAALKQDSDMLSAIHYLPQRVSPKKMSSVLRSPVWSWMLKARGYKRLASRPTRTSSAHCHTAGCSELKIPQDIFIYNFNMNCIKDTQIAERCRDLFPSFWPDSWTEIPVSQPRGLDDLTRHRQPTRAIDTNFQKSRRVLFIQDKQ